ncbi:MAG: DUF2214 family protein [Myxococcaceae bacterium]|nr:DUF2214 family protein [Myxococcaceae bacterium]
MPPAHLAALLSTLHLLALAIGLPSIFLRARALAGLKSPDDEKQLARVFAADNVWGLAAILWFATGFARLLGPVEKGTAFYTHSGAFWLKMALFAALFTLELYPMITLIRWRLRQRKKRPLDLSSIGLLTWFSRIEVVLTTSMPFAASAMARGIGFGWSPFD